MSAANKLENIQDILIKVQDLENSYRAIIEKTGTVVLEMMEAGMDSTADKLNNILDQASQSAEKIQNIGEDLEIERNKLQNQ